MTSYTRELARLTTSLVAIVDATANFRGAP
jgi:hypothetical protein